MTVCVEIALCCSMIKQYAGDIWFLLENACVFGFLYTSEYNIKFII